MENQQGYGQGSNPKQPLPIHLNLTQEILRMILLERGRQDAKWGEQNHNPAYYFAIWAEEFGEVAKEVVEYSFPRGLENMEAAEVRMLKELVQAAAVNVAMIESIWRRRANASQDKLQEG